MKKSTLQKLEYCDYREVINMVDDKEISEFLEM